MAKKVAPKKAVEAAPEPAPAKKTAAKVAKKPRARAEPVPEAEPSVAPPPADGDELRHALAAAEEQRAAEAAAADRASAKMRLALDEAQAELRNLRAAIETSKVDQQWQSQASVRDVGDAQAARETAERRADELQARLDAAVSDLDARRGELEGARRELTELRAALDGRAIGDPAGAARNRCPKCGERMIEAELGGVKVDRCRGCDAVCIDAVVIERMLPRSPDRTTLTDVPTLGAAPAEASLPESEKPGFWKGLFKRKPQKEGE